MSNSYDVAVIGAGAGGMVCAAKLKERGFNVCLVEKLNKPGKKLSVTGNGRCNLTNTDMNVNKYYSDELPLVKEVIDAFDEKDTISYLEGCGLVTKEKNGYVYPYNENAVSVVNLLQSRLASLMVKTEYNFNVSEIKKDKDGFLIKDDKKNVIKAKKVVLACGGMSALSADTKYNALTLIKDFDIKTVIMHPALCALTCKDLIIGDTKTENTKGTDFASIAGVRTNAAVKVNLYDKNGNKKILYYYRKNDIFGEALFKVYSDRELFVLAKKKCTVLFFPYDLAERCPEVNCIYHIELLRNLPD